MEAKEHQEEDSLVKAQVKVWEQGKTQMKNSL